MGLFDRAKNAFGGGQAQGDWAAQAAAAQELAQSHLAQAGYTDGSMVTMQNAAGVQSAMQADHDVLNAYGQELNRIIAVGQPGQGIIRSAVDTGERTAGNPWFQIEVEVQLPGAAPYVVTKREMVPTVSAAMYAVGSSHSVAVDPANPQNIALTS